MKDSWIRSNLVWSGLRPFELVCGHLNQFFDPLWLSVGSRRIRVTAYVYTLVNQRQMREKRREQTTHPIFHYLVVGACSHLPHHKIVKNSGPLKRGASDAGQVKAIS